LDLIYRTIEIRGIVNSLLYQQAKFLKENVMLEVTPLAVEQIAEYFKDREVAPVRIFLNEGG